MVQFLFLFPPVIIIFHLHQKNCLLKSWKIS
uniref:Uncharacterized protein n=1 Tax=Rhizophora mucronata TaxID=61149 RepID=A0A2P2PT47_RHIMU